MMRELGWALVLVILLAGGGAWLFSRSESSGSFTSYLSSKVPSEQVLALRAADQSLVQDVVTRLQRHDGDEREIDLKNPSERDRRFLLETLSSGTAEARRSAGRVLTEVGEARAVPLLLRLNGPHGEGDWACSSGLEVLRYLSAEEASALMIEALADKTHPPSPACQEPLKEKVALLMENFPSLPLYLLEQVSVAGCSYLLLHHAPEGTLEARAVIAAMKEKGGELAPLAQSWLDTHPPQDDVHE